MYLLQCNKPDGYTWERCTAHYFFELYKDMSEEEIREYRINHSEEYKEPLNKYCEQLNDRFPKPFKPARVNETAT